jgi:hypothetical protein
VRRHHIQACQIWRRHRPWRERHGAAGADPTVSTAIAQAAMLTRWDISDDITDWGRGRYTHALASSRGGHSKAGSAPAARSRPRPRRGADGNC